MTLTARGADADPIYQFRIGGTVYGLDQVRFDPKAKVLYVHGNYGEVILDPTHTPSFEVEMLDITLPAYMRQSMLNGGWVKHRLPAAVALLSNR